MYMLEQSYLGTVHAKLMIYSLIWLSTYIHVLYVRWPVSKIIKLQSLFNQEAFHFRRLRPVAIRRRGLPLLFLEPDSHSLMTDDMTYRFTQGLWQAAQNESSPVERFPDYLVVQVGIIQCMQCVIYSLYTQIVHIYMCMYLKVANTLFVSWYNSYVCMYIHMYACMYVCMYVLRWDCTLASIVGTTTRRGSTPL